MNIGMDDAGVGGGVVGGRQGRRGKEREEQEDELVKR